MRGEGKGDGKGERKGKGVPAKESVLCGKIREVLSWINAQTDNWSGEERVVELVPQEGGLLVQLKLLIQNLRKLEHELLVGDSLEMKVARLKLNRFLYLCEGFLELGELASKQPLILILCLLMLFDTPQ